jgi:D-amino-acid dehydrogenase
MKICILGAGVVGLTSAWALSETGHDVVLVDRHATAGAEASAANGAQLSYAFVSPLASPAMLRKLPSMFLGGDNAIRASFDAELVRWGIKFLKACTAREIAHTVAAQLALATLSRAELAHLTQAQELEFGLRTAGKLVVYRSADDFTAARPGPKAPVAQQVLTHMECLALEPGLKLKASAFAGGIYTPSEQVGDCAAFCAELFARLQRRNNLTIHMATPLGKPVISGGKLVAIETQQDCIDADLFVLSLGSESKAFARACGFDLPIYPVKGHSITILGDALSHSVTDYSRKIVYAPLGGGTRIAGFADFKGYDRTVEPSRIATLEAEAFEMFGIKSLAPSSPDLIKPWAGLRPVTPDSRPIIGPSPVRGLFLNTGQGMLGWTLACGSARLAADLIDGRAPSCPAEPFAVARFL